MNTFNKKSLCVALAATGLLAGGAAQAVNLSEDGTGMVLVFPYYTVRTPSGGNAYNTYINVTNSTAVAKSVKIRFREGKNSREVLDFNIFLSPVDMWTGAVVPTSDGAAVVTADRSCTIPSFTFADSTVGTVSSPVPFRNNAYTNTTLGDARDGGGESLDRTREGYVEVFEMAEYAAGTTTAAGALHNQTTGLPANCAAITDATAKADGTMPGGGVFGSLQLINPGAGASMSVNAVALDNFYMPGQAPGTTNMYFTTGSVSPNMANAGTTSAVKSGANLTVSTGWATNTADAASAVLMHDSILNEYFSDSAALSLTDWVVTFPTKNFYVDPAPVRAPFQRAWDTVKGQSCDDVSFGVRDREELVKAAAAAAGADFSPPNAGPAVNTPTLCYEANVVTFNSSGLLGSTNSTLNINTVVGTAGGTAKNGWASIIFDRFGAVAGPGKLINTVNTVQTPLATGVSGAAQVTATYTGLPVVGFNVWKYTNSALKVGSVVSNVPTNYGMGVPHKSRTTITTP